MGKSNIEWTDSVWQPVSGCTPVSEGCRNCFAARMAATRLKHHPRYEGLATIENGRARWTGEVRLNYDVLEQPLHWKKSRRVFVASMGDWLHPDVPFSYAALMFSVMSQTRQHTYQLLTKRAERLPPFFHWAVEGDGTPLFEWPLPNVHLGVSVENQAAADERIPLLLQTPAAVRFVSVEPYLSPINLTPWLRECGGGSFPIGLPIHQPCLPSTWHQPPLDWVIVGGESGPGARPMHPDWVRSLRDQCQTAGVPYFFKAWGAWAPSQQVDRGDAWENIFLSPDGSIVPSDTKPPPGAIGTRVWRFGKKAAGHLLDGREHQEFPKCS